MPAPRPPDFDTLSLHAGQHPDPATGARAAPIHETASYVFAEADHAAGLFILERAGHLLTVERSDQVLAALTLLERGLGSSKAS